MSVTDQIVRLSIRAFFIALMALIAMTAASAEGRHVDQTASESLTLSTPMPTSSALGQTGEHDSGENSRRSGEAVHCAFGHCVHGFAASPLDQGVRRLQPRIEPYDVRAAQPLPDALTDGPDYPPRT